ncbi:hypothetical protein LEMLEM_LOCUS3800 [Lemmus lemmus]
MASLTGSRSRNYSRCALESVRKRRLKDSKRQGWRMTPRKRHLPDTTGLMHI